MKLSEILGVKEASKGDGETSQKEGPEIPFFLKGLLKPEMIGQMQTMLVELPAALKAWTENMVRMAQVQEVHFGLSKETHAEVQHIRALIERPIVTPGIHAAMIVESAEDPRNREFQTVHFDPQKDDTYKEGFETAITGPEGMYPLGGE